MNIRPLPFAVLGLFLVAATALAHAGATGIVKERMDGMSAMADVMKRLSPMMQGSAEYDVTAVRDGAAIIAAHSGEGLTSRFPAGTGGGHSEAREEIWTEWRDFEAFAIQMERLAEALGAAAETGVGGMSGAGTMMGGQAATMGAGMMGGGQKRMTAEQLSDMPADAIFGMVSQTCSACHTRFRLEKK